MLERLRAGTPPRLGAQALQAAQERIDHLLPLLLAQPGSGYPGDVTADGIRKAQAAWLAYRSAWGDFAAMAYPDWGATGAQAWVSTKRADMLSHLLPSP